MTKQELQEVLKQHALWLNDNGGQRADLRGANLLGADLQGADLQRADLQYANLLVADLRRADLRGADLRGADLRGADLRGANNYFLQCQEEGSFIAFKKCKNDVIVKLEIPSTAKRSSATSRKCRASEAIVLEIFGAEKAISKYDDLFTYEVGQHITIDNFDEDRFNECSTGIHFFITREEAENY